jgi:hypothetical protein
MNYHIFEAYAPEHLKLYVSYEQEFVVMFWE